MCQQLQVGRGRPERGRIGRMAVDDGADVRPGAVDAGVQDGLEVQDGVRVVERDDVLRLDLVQGDALALDPDLPLRAAGAHVPERQVGVALRSEDAAGPGDLLAKALDHGQHQRRSVGGYSGCGKPNTITTSSSPVFATACQTPAGMWTASPCANGTASSSSRSSPDPDTT